jgi:hypothetical protein
MILILIGIATLLILSPIVYFLYHSDYSYSLGYMYSELAKIRAKEKRDAARAETTQSQLREQTIENAKLKAELAEKRYQTKQLRIRLDNLQLKLDNLQIEKLNDFRGIRIRALEAELAELKKLNMASAKAQIEAYAPQIIESERAAKDECLDALEKYAHIGLYTFTNSTNMTYFAREVLKKYRGSK